MTNTAAAQPLVLTTSRARRGQRPLTEQAVRFLCNHYGWKSTAGYEDAGEVFIGADYAGRLNAECDTLTLDRGGLRRSEAPRIAVVA